MLGDDIDPTTEHAGNADGGWGPAAEGLPRYFRSIGQIPLLRPEMEIHLAQTIERGVQAAETLRSDSGLSGIDADPLNDQIEAGVEARDRLIEANLRLVVSIARRYVNRGLDLDDLIQAGNIGLLRATQKFDYRRGNRFSTYATWWVRQAVMRAISDQGRTVRIPAHLQDAARRALRHETLILQSEGRETPMDELGRVAGISTERLQYVNRMIPSLASLDAAIDDASGTPLTDIVADPDAEALDAGADKELLAAVMNSALGALSERERLVLARRYGFNGQVEQTFGAIGRDLGVTKERVRQIEASAMLKLRRPAVAAPLRNFSH